MPNIVVNAKKIWLSQGQIIGGGGFGTVYADNGIAYKIFHDANEIIPDQKIKSLAAIKDSRVIKPKDLIYDGHNKRIGYTMDHVDNTDPLCRLFTKAYKKIINVCILTKTTKRISFLIRWEILKPCEFMILLLITHLASLQKARRLLFLVDVNFIQWRQNDCRDNERRRKRILAN